MPKNIVQTREDELEEKSLTPEDTENPETADETEEEELLDKDEMDPFGDKWEE
jgi:hypothetical protein